ncbi:VOC family protein [Nocardioides pocheonensis]|uniref:VOC family protein n=1 Tax=Nocardioides pocheonensis TaxID=661485 RepID=A0A3N0GUN6_9ACTN|nr:VOC family protein [Nocardioides pocheonensis]RNM16121.1 VOC family protein [Nocardioides pocheonensis]
MTDPTGDTVREVQITFDCADPGAQAEFWAAALGYRLQPPPPGFDTWDAALDSLGVPADRRNDRSAIVPPEGASGPRVFFQRVPEGKTAKNRVHLDVRAAPGLEGEARMQRLGEARDRLVALGARETGRFEPGEEMSGGFIVMSDPEGNEFCLD